MNEELKSYRIIALTILPTEICIGCSIIPSDAQYDDIYSSVYGPASKKAASNGSMKIAVSVFVNKISAYD